MFGIGDAELAIIVLFAFLMFGPDKLPGMGRTIGRALRQFRTAQDGVSKVVQSEIIDPIQNAADSPAGKAAAEAAEEDSDLPDDAEAKPAETFAQRRARLAAEKAAAAGAAAPAAAAAANPDSDDDLDAAADEAQAKAEPAVEEPEPEPDPTSAAALYGLDDDDDEEDA